MFRLAVGWSRVPEKPRKPSGGEISTSKGAEPAKPVTISTHKQLAAKTAEIVSRLNQDPELARLLLVNPAAAIQDAGYSLSPEILKHVLETVRHSKVTAEKRQGLEALLEKEFGEHPQPLDPVWLKRALFEKLKLQPLDTAGREPVYRNALSPELLKRLGKFRPSLRRAKVATPKPLHGVALQVSLCHKWPGRFDLDAPLDKLAPAAAPPAAVDLNTLYFYKDSHPLVRSLIELAVIQRSSFPIHSPDSYRKIRSGEKPNPLRTWVKAVRFKQS